MSGEFVDTNVLLYAHDSGAGPKRVRAAALLERLGDERRGLVSSQVLTEFYVAAARELPGRLDHRTGPAIVRDFGTWPVFLPASARSSRERGWPVMLSAGTRVGPYEIAGSRN